MNSLVRERTEPGSVPVITGLKSLQHMQNQSILIDVGTSTTDSDSVSKAFGTMAYKAKIFDFQKLAVYLHRKEADKN